MLSVADKTVNKTDPNLSLLELVFHKEVTCPRRGWNVPELGFKPKSGVLLGLCFSPSPQNSLPLGALLPWGT